MVVFGTSVAVMFVANVILYWRIRSYEWKPKVSEVILGILELLTPNWMIFSKLSLYVILCNMFSQQQSKRALFHWRHAWDAIVVTFRKRRGPNRMFVLLTMAVFFFQVMPFFGEGSISYLYVTKH